MQPLVLASSNAGKVREFNELLAGHRFQVVPQSDLGIQSVEETGLTFIENALLKARHAAGVSGWPALADDSGLVVPALGGAPGLRSARYAGPEADDSANNRCLLQALAEQPHLPREAYFYCILVLLRHPEDPAPLVCEGRWPGRIVETPRGLQGFGYDPVFEPYAPASPSGDTGIAATFLGLTAAELSLAEKQRLSHRGIALRTLLGQLEASPMRWNP